MFQLPFSNASDIKLFESNGRVYAAVSILEELPSSEEVSEIYLIGTKGIVNVTKTVSYRTWKAVTADVSRYRNNTIITFTNTQNSSDVNLECVSSTPMLFTSTGDLMPLATITGCNVVKIITKQINHYEILVVSITAGLYSETEAVVYKVKMNGTYAVLQTISIQYASDAMFLEVRGALFLVIANQYQMSEVSIAVEYKISSQVYL